MKNKTLLIAFLSAAAFVVGCNKDKTTAQQIDKVQTETKQDAQDMKNYTFAQKDEFVKAMQTQLTALDKDLDTLSAKIDRSSDAVKAEAKPKLQALRDQAAKLNDQLPMPRTPRNPLGTESKQIPKKPMTPWPTASPKPASG